MTTYYDDYHDSGCEATGIESGISSWRILNLRWKRFYLSNPTQVYWGSVVYYEITVSCYWVDIALAVSQYEKGGNNLPEILPLLYF